MYFKTIIVHIYMNVHRLQDELFSECGTDFDSKFEEVLGSDGTDRVKSKTRSRHAVLTEIKMAVIDKALLKVG